MKKKQLGELTMEQRRALFQVKVRDAIEKSGCFIVCVFGGDTGFAYSIGIPTTFPGAAEIIIMGLDPDQQGHIINNIVQLMREGQTFEAGKQYSGILRDMPIYLGRVKPEHYDDHFGQAQIYHKSRTDFPVLQLVWPDSKGRFPWEKGFEEKFREKQPLLFEAQSTAVRKEQEG